MVEYKHLKPESSLPVLKVSGYFKAAVIIEANCSEEWRNTVSDWLVKTGCKYMCAWGLECSKWDDAVDWSSIALCGESEEEFVMTTWHENDSLKEFFEFVKTSAIHSCHELEECIIVHIAEQSNYEAVVNEFTHT